MRVAIKKHLKQTILRSFVIFGVLGLVYVALIYIPRVRVQSNDQSMSEKQLFVSKVDEYSLLASELSLYSPKNASILGELNSYVIQLKSLTTSISSQQSFVDNNYPDKIDHFNQAAESLQVSWLELDGFYSYVDILFAYNPGEELPTDGSVSNTELTKRAQQASSGLQAFLNTNKTYQANNQFQLNDGSTRSYPQVRSFSLSDRTLSAINQAKACFDTYTPPSNSTCTAEVISIKKSLLDEMQNIMQNDQLQQAQVSLNDIKSAVESTL